MKQFLSLLIFTTLFLFGCVPASIFYYEYSLAKPMSADDMSYSDNKIDAKFNITRKSINFLIRNKTNETLKIIWDDAAIIQNGRSKRIIHSGVNYVNKGNPQTPSVIPANTSIEDLALPTENIYYNSGLGMWQENDLFIVKSHKSELIQPILNQKGQKFALYLPVSYQGKTIEYNFEFLIKDVTKINNEAFSID